MVEPDASCILLPFGYFMPPVCCNIMYSDTMSIASLWVVLSGEAFPMHTMITTIELFEGQPILHNISLCLRFLTTGITTSQELPTPLKWLNLGSHCAHQHPDYKCFFCLFVCFFHDQVAWQCNSLVGQTLEPDIDYAMGTDLCKTVTSLIRSVQLMTVQTLKHN